MYPERIVDKEVATSRGPSSVEVDENGNHPTVNSEKSPKDSSVVSDDSLSPKLWPARKKWITLAILSSFAFLHPLSETMIAPAIDAIAEDLHFTGGYDSMLCLSIFLIGIALGPLILAPLSELYGRRPVLIQGGIFYTIWTLLCGFSKTRVHLFVFRTLSGFGASVALAVGGGVIGDMWIAEERGRAIAWYLLAPLLGPTLGPIIGGFVTDSQSWHWVFWAFAAASFVFLLIAIFLYHETFEPILRDARDMETNIEGAVRAGRLDRSKMAFSKIKISIVRPLRMASTQPIVQILAVFMALVYGIMFLFLFTYPILWTERYHQSVKISSLNYISAGIGFTIGAQVAGHANDRIYILLKTRNNGVGKPEFRVPILIPGAFLITIGLLVYGWTGQARAHWIVPNLGSLLFCIGCMLCSSGVSTFAIDTYTTYAASALSAFNVLRNISAILFPLFAPYMFADLGFGVGCSILAGSWALLSPLIIWLLWKCGERIRKRWGSVELKE